MEPQFCPNCNNMLYPREDRAARRLVFSCRHCGYADDAALENHCVFRHVVTHASMDQTLGRVDLSNDPTYPRVRRQCPNCGFAEAVFFMSKAKSPETTMQLYFACCSDQCNHRWTVNVKNSA
ncbi:DNA-directed RNA polymerase II subunit RPB9 [Cladochytrium tenue]|nr:DNA-directed RNA polymerase II subunit RPB9 [Cladochytrium tenue]